MLTAKQETFVQELVKGKSQREAYRAAYNADRMKDATIDSKASILFKNGKIRARYSELMGNAASKAVATREEILAELTAIALPPKNKEGERAQESAQDKNTRIKALELLGKYHALFTEKVQNDGEVSIKVTMDGELSGYAK